MNILLIGHAFAPGLGSEPGLTWNWARHLSAVHDVWVLAHPQHREAVERFLAENPTSSIHPVWVTLPPRLDPWNPRRGERWIRLHYLLWQWHALRKAWQLHGQHRFDLAHHVSPGTVGAASLFWRLPIPFVWGPLGGAQTAPSSFRDVFGPAWRGEQIRSLRLRLLQATPGLRRAARRAALVLATNQETARYLRRAGARRVELFLDNGLTEEFLPPDPPTRPEREEMTLLWAGRLEPRKALGLVLEALATAPDVPVRVLVAGEGPMRDAWEAMARRLDLGERVQFLGQVPRDELMRLFAESDAFAFSSVRDSFGSVVLEAMAHALPIVTLDHQGVGAFLPQDTSIKVPVTTPDETAAAFADGLRRLARSPNERLAMGHAAWRFARDQRWDLRARQMSTWYEECVDREHSGLRQPAPSTHGEPSMNEA